MNSTGLISVITPTFNHENYIGSCMASVVAQTYPHWEQVIIDDGSSDRTREIIQTNTDSRIKYIYQENQGIEALAHTYNRALATCTGDLIAILEGDDTWPAYKLEKMVGAFDDADVVIAYGEMHEIDPQGKLARNISMTSRKRRKLAKSVLCNDPVPTAARYMLTVHGHSLIPASTVVIRRSALEAIGGFQYVSGQCYVDFPTFIELAFQGKFVYFPDIVGYRRIHAQSATVQLSTGMTAVAKDHLSLLFAQPRFGLTSADQAAIEKDWQNVFSGHELALGRLAALENRWKHARQHFAHALSSSDLRLSAAAAAGWLLSWGKRDLENVFRLAGRATMKTN